MNATLWILNSLQDTIMMIELTCIVTDCSLFIRFTFAIRNCDAKRAKQTHNRTHLGVFRLLLSQIGIVPKDIKVWVFCVQYLRTVKLKGNPMITSTKHSLFGCLLGIAFAFDVVLWLHKVWPPRTIATYQMCVCWHSQIFSSDRNGSIKLNDMMIRICMTIQRHKIHCNENK